LNPIPKQHITACSLVITFLSNKKLYLDLKRQKMGDWKSSYRDNRREEVVLSRMKTGTCRYQSQHYYQIGDTNPMNKYNLRGVANNIEHVILSCPKWGAFRIMIYEQNKKQKLPNSISSVLGDKFNHGILFTYLKAIKYFDLI